MDNTVFSVLAVIVHCPDQGIYLGVYSGGGGLASILMASSYLGGSNICKGNWTILVVHLQPCGLIDLSEVLYNMYSCSCVKTNRQLLENGNLRCIDTEIYKWHVYSIEKMFFEHDEYEYSWS